MGILFYFGIFYSAGLTLWMVWKRIIREVNQYLPDGDQYPTSVWAFSPRSSQSPINQFKILETASAIFPHELPSVVVLSYLGFDDFILHTLRAV
jgi:hypothetical protein